MSTTLRQICVFCGSSSGSSPIYAADAARLGGVLARQGITLVYGGAQVGLMGVLADAALAEGGAVIGVIPESLSAREIAHPRLTRLHLVKDLQERKALMAELADAFIALPGGFGTLDELFEVLTWAQLGLHVKPCGLLNTGGYFNPLVTLLNHATQEEFLRAEHRAFVLVDDNLERLLAALGGASLPRVSKVPFLRGSSE